MAFGIRTLLAFGKQRIINLSVKSIRTLSMTLKRRFPSATERDRRPDQTKALAAIFTTPEGMQIDESEEQERNAPASMRESLEFNSNVTVSSFSHPSKQESQRTSTDEGMRMDESEEQSINAPLSIRESLESDSNETEVRREPPRKQWAQDLNRRRNGD
jgi:hypothetical protein